MVFGVVILLLAVLVLIKWGFRRDEHSGVPIGIALIVFGLMFALLFTERPGYPRPSGRGTVPIHDE